MPSREEMIQFLKTQAPAESAQPSREEMISYLKNQNNSSEEQANPIASGVRKFIQGASSGISDEIAGGFEAAGRAVGLEGVGGPMKNIRVSKDGPTLDSKELKKAYIAGRDAERATLAKDAQDNPATSAVADFAGMVLSPVNKVTGPLGGKVGGMVAGGAQALGNSEANNVADLSRDTMGGMLLGGAIGGAAEAATPYIAKGIQKGGAKALDMADSFAARALGAERGTIKKFGAKAVKAAGRYGLDNDIVNKLGGTDDKIAANEATKQAAMNARKAAYDQIDEAGASVFNPVDVADKVKAKILGGKNMAHKDVQELADTLQPHLENILSRGENNISMAEAQDLVSSLSKKAKFDASRSSEANEVAKNVYHVVRDAINESAEKSAEKLGSTGLRNTIEGANKLYSQGKVAGELLKNRAAREGGNKFISLTDTIAGTGALGYGSATGDWKGAAQGLVAKKFLEKYGAQLAARGLDGIGKKLLSVPEMAQLAEKSPAAFQSVLKHFETPKASLPPAASEPTNEKDFVQKKGREKWAADGLKKVQEHDSSLKGAALDSPKIKDLLAIASDLKPGSKAMASVVAKIKALKDKGA